MYKYDSREGFGSQNSWLEKWCHNNILYLGIVDIVFPTSLG